MAPTPLIATALAIAALALATLAHAALVGPDAAPHQSAAAAQSEGLPPVYLHDDSDSDSAPDSDSDNDSDDGGATDLDRLTHGSPLTVSPADAVLLGPDRGDSALTVATAAASGDDDHHGPTMVPLPAAAVLLASALAGLSLFRRR